MNTQFNYHCGIQAIGTTTANLWTMHDRGHYDISENILTITDGWASLEDLPFANYILEFTARAPQETQQVQIWAGFRHFHSDYRYVVALRGGSNNHLYLARLGAEGYDKMLALRPLEWTPQPGIWYRLRVVCAGTQIAVYLNDEKLPTLCVTDDDAPFREGSISLGGSYLPTQFKDVRITEIRADYLADVKAAPDYLASLTPSKEERQRQRARERAAYRPYVIPAAFDQRQEFSLDGNWLFIPDYEVAGNPSLPDYDDANAHIIQVPSSWVPLQAWLEGENMRDMNKGMNDNYLVEEMTRCLNQTFDFQNTASAWYRHYLDFPKEICRKHVVLDFEGIALISAIYLNGVRIHENIGMFAPMQIDISDYVQEGRNLIAIEVHRRLSDESEHAFDISGVESNYTTAWNILDQKDLSEEADTPCERREFCTDDIAHGFYGNNPGGIWRKVRLIISNKASVRDCYFRPTLNDATIEVCYANNSDSRVPTSLFYSLTHKTTGEYLCGGLIESVTLGADEERTLSFTTPKVSPLLWGPGTPNLYQLEFVLTQGNTTLDIYQEQVGFRTVEFEGQTLMYNGSPLWVRGGNHMPAHVKPNDRLLAERFLQLALEHNVIATRTHVAPWTSVWLDAADEIGVMVSFEGTWSWLMLEHIPSNKSIILWKEELAKLLKRHRNRPSLFLMTMNNEMKFYLHEAPDKVVIEKGRILEGGIRIARELLPHLPLVCDSAYNRNQALRNGRYERIILAEGYDDGDMDDPHGYYGWYNPCFFHFMNGEFGRDYTVPGRPCMSQECSTGYPRAEDGLPTRAYLFMHQTPQTTVGKKAYEFCNPAYFLTRHAMLTKELVETLRRMEHERTCGLLLFAFETWFYFQHDSLRIQPMLSAKKLQTAYQPILASIELWGRHFYAGSTLSTNITLINDSLERKTLTKPIVEISVCTDGDVLNSPVILEFDTIPYFQTASMPLSLSFPDTLCQDRLDAKLMVKIRSEGQLVSSNEYDILLSSHDWEVSKPCKDQLYYFADDNTTRTLLNHYHLPGQSVSCIDEITSGTAAILKRLIISGPIEQTTAVALHAFIENGGKVILLGQHTLPSELLPKHEISFTECRQEIITMNIPESSIFQGIEPLDLSWFSDGRNVPYVAAGRYTVDRFDQNIRVLAETLDWHGYIDRPTDYKKFGGTPLFCVKIGDGDILISSLRTDAYEFDPVASRLTNRMINWDFDHS